LFIGLVVKHPGPSPSAGEGRLVDSVKNKRRVHLG